MINLEALIKKDLHIPTQVSYRSCDRIRIVVPENMTSQIKLCPVLIAYHPISSIMPAKIFCRMNTWHVNIATKHITLKLDWIDKAECKEREKPSDNNEHNIPSSGNNNDTTASRTSEHLCSRTGNIISSNTIYIMFDKVVF